MSFSRYFVLFQPTPVDIARDDGSSNSSTQDSPTDNSQSISLPPATSTSIDSTSTTSATSSIDSATSTSATDSVSSTSSTDSASSTSSTDSGTSTDSATSASTTVSSTVASTTTAVQSVPSDLTFILTESSLALASVSATPSLSLSDPDAPTTTISLTASATAALQTAALPNGLPSRIYLPTGPTENPGAGYSYISLLFDNYLDWNFICTNPVSSTQVFAMMPLILSTALGTSGDSIKTFALEVRIPAGYTGPQDVDMLQTLYLGWIPTKFVDTLALQLKSKNSAFYTGTDNPVAAELAQHIISAFALDSVAPDNASGAAGAGGGSGSGSSSQDSATGATSQSKTRQDAIIGVVTALGVIAVLVLVFLAFRAFRRRAELAHRRLSDPPDVHGARPDGRDFDQDSVGGQRRRSFYFAEDSLRGFQGERGDDGAFDSRSPAGMTQRRNVMPAAISAPILQQSSMNW
ncbi:hypothetical protein B0H16DRAFT_1332714 [Mycena metata]|uniref:Uncharacterized protein n=1 Tax=Mycena metata TaxID=1033252 RepID=A0AAD7HQ75_9AGAR|nr:hypothetical protein B0H16DRAFT_1332714 [Mycena metata]